MEKKIIITKDGSHTVAVPAMNVMYHSIHGAITESKHVFIEAGFGSTGQAGQNTRVTSQFEPARPVEPNRPDGLRSGFEPARPVDHLLEAGFGTGLNALLTIIETERLQQPVHYTAIELFPLDMSEISSLNYCDQLGRQDLQDVFKELHQSDWEKDIAITPFFTLHKMKCDIINLSTHQLVNLIYYDAFAPAAQPELWTKEVFQNLHGMMADDGILVTYCSKGDVKRAMIAGGFEVEKLPGPPGKREMLRAKKHDA